MAHELQIFDGSNKISALDDPRLVKLALNHKTKTLAATDLITMILKGMPDCEGKINIGGSESASFGIKFKEDDKLIADFQLTVSLPRPGGNYPPMIYIDDVGVREDYRGKGFSKFLMRNVGEVADALDIPELRIKAVQKGAMLWPRFGFVPFDEVNKDDLEAWNYIKDTLTRNMVNLKGRCDIADEARLIGYVADVLAKGYADPSENRPENIWLLANVRNPKLKVFDTNEQQVFDKNNNPLLVEPAEVLFENVTFVAKLNFQPGSEHRRQFDLAMQAIHGLEKVNFMRN